jgi:hypothetical protein
MWSSFNGLSGKGNGQPSNIASRTAGFRLG